MLLVNFSHPKYTTLCCCVHIEIDTYPRKVELMNQD